MKILKQVSLDRVRVEKVFGFEDYYVTEYGDVYSTKRNKIKKLKSSPNNSGYLGVSLYKNDVCHPTAIHRIVATTFISNKELDKSVNHKDGNKLNNHFSNLEFMSCQDNITHAIKNGLFNNRGSRNACSKLKENDVIEILGMLKNKESKTYIGRRYGVTACAIHHIAAGRNWKHLTNKS